MDHMECFHTQIDASLPFLFLLYASRFSMRARPNRDDGRFFIRYEMAVTVTTHCRPNSDRVRPIFLARFPARVAEIAYL